MTEEELEVYKDLVVATPSCVDLLACITETLRKKLLYLRMYILNIFVDHKAIGVDRLKQQSKFIGECESLFVGDESYVTKHLDMGDRTDNIPTGKTHIDLSVIADSERLHHFIDGRSFIPELHFILRIIVSRRVMNVAVPSSSS